METTKNGETCGNPKIKKADEEQGRETSRYKWGEIEEEIAVMRGVEGYNPDEEKENGRKK